MPKKTDNLTPAAVEAAITIKLARAYLINGEPITALARLRSAAAMIEAIAVGLPGYTHNLIAFSEARCPECNGHSIRRSRGAAHSTDTCERGHKFNTPTAPEQEPPTVTDYNPTYYEGLKDGELSALNSAAHWCDTIRDATMTTSDEARGANACANAIRAIITKLGGTSPRIVWKAALDSRDRHASARLPVTPPAPEPTAQPATVQAVTPPFPFCAGHESGNVWLITHAHKVYPNVWCGMCVEVGTGIHSQGLHVGQLSVDLSPSNLKPLPFYIQKGATTNHVAVVTALNEVAHQVEATDFTPATKRRIAEICNRVLKAGL